MAENSKIEWCDHTFNPWIGCQKVSPGCDHCYAEAMMDKRYGISDKVLSQKNARNPRYWEQTKAWVAREIARAKAKHQSRIAPDMTASATTAADRDHGRPAAERQAELLFERRPRRLAAERLQEIAEGRTVAQAVGRETAGSLDPRVVGIDGLACRLGHEAGDDQVRERGARQRRGAEGCQVQSVHGRDPVRALCVKLWQFSLE